MKKKTLIYLIFLAVIIICAIFIYFLKIDDKINNNINNNTGQEKLLENNNSDKKSASLKTSKKSQTIIPESYLLDVPFTSQAPYANWDFDHNEGCEEASVLMMKEFISSNHIEKLDPKYADNQIMKMINYEKDIIGSHIDFTANQTVKYLLKDFYKINTKVVSLDLEIIKQNISNSKPVIVPFAGRELHNPNFKTPGPIYHMLIIRGYKNNGSTIITNDPGTRNGQSYEYSWDTILSAAHDWNGSAEKMLSGKKVMIILN
jgi:hypothetical protein